MTLNYLFFDKDGTVGNFAREGFFPGAIDTLKSQYGQGRKLVCVTSNKGPRARAHLDPINDILGEYIDNEILTHRNWYVSPNGDIQRLDEVACMGTMLFPKVREDIFSKLDVINPKLDQLEDQFLDDEISGLEYKRKKKELEEQRKDCFSEYNRLDQLVWRESGKPFPQELQYKNPHLSRGWNNKDIFLVKRVLAKQRYQEARVVMVGDNIDTSCGRTDPTTPTIIINKRQFPKEWQAIGKLADRLYEGADMPRMHYDALFNQANNSIEKRVPLWGEDLVRKHKDIIHAGERFQLVKGPKLGRLAYWLGPA